MSARGDAGRSPAALGHQPALDGLRGACLLAVLLFHSDFAWMSGGFLGVSTFFTLSGFLITTLLVDERERTGRVSLAAFWDRRLRRLAPAALLGIAGVVGTAPLWLPRAAEERLAGDVIAALAYVVNWRYARADYAYELIFTDPSPLQHFWSLAIEGQFYLFFPLLVGLVLRRGGLARLAAVLSTLTAASVALSFVPSLAREGTYRLYYGSDARAAEILIGATAALVARRARTGARPDLGRVLRWLSPPALLAVAAAWIFARVDQPWLYRGGFAAYATLSAVVVLAATEATAARALLDRRALRWLGRVSYGAYVYHWPVFLVLSEARTGLGPIALLASRLAATLLLAEASHRFVEEPVRRRRLLEGRRLAVAAAAVSVAVAAVALATSPVPWAMRLDALAASAGEEAPDAEGGARTTRWALFGDSTALSLSPGLRAFVGSREGLQMVHGRTRLGCGLLDQGEYFNQGAWHVVPADCADPARDWQERARQFGADVAIVLTGPWEARDWRLSPDGPVLRLGDPELDEAVRLSVVEVMDALAAAGVEVVWLTAPQLGVSPETRPERRPALAKAAEPARVERLNEIVRAEAARRDGVHVVDLAGWMSRWQAAELDPELRPDATHFSAAGAARVAEEFLGPEVLRRTGAAGGRLAPGRADRSL